MKLHTKVVLARANPSFAPGLATRPSTRCTFTQRKIVWCTGTCQTRTQTRRRSSVSQWMQPHRWTRAIHLSGTVWVVVDEHYILFTRTNSPAVREEFKERGVSIKFLPPKGKYFNPIELLFNDLKSHYIRPNFPKNGKLLSKSKIQALVREYMDETAPSTLPGFFSARANGKDAIANKIL